MKIFKETELWYDKPDGNRGFVSFDFNNYMSVRSALSDIVGDSFADAFSNELYNFTNDTKLEKEALYSAIEEQVDYIEEEQEDLSDQISGSANSIRDILNELNDITKDNSEINNRINKILSKLDDVEECASGISGGIYELRDVLELYK